MNLWDTRVISGVLIAGASLLGAGAAAAEAAPVASLTYIETSLDAGTFRYDYTLANDTDPLTDPGSDIFFLSLAPAPDASVVASALPAGWDSISGAGFVDAFSLFMGAAPFGADLGPADTLAFSFTFDAPVGAVPFQVLFANPHDATNPVHLEGTAQASPGVTPVPEPASIFLLGAGLGAMALRRRSSHRGGTFPPDTEDVVPPSHLQ